MSQEFNKAGASASLLQAIYIDATNTIRHYDVLRATFTTFFGTCLSLVLTLSSAASFQNILPKLLLSATGACLVLSVLSLVIVLKIDTLINEQRARASLALSRMSALIDCSEITSISQEASNKISSLVKRFRLGYLWASIFVFIAICNLAVFGWSIFALLR